MSVQHLLSFLLVEHRILFTNVWLRALVKKLLLFEGSPDIPLQFGNHVLRVDFCPISTILLSKFQI